MEDFLKFLLIVGVILVGIFKEVSKNSKSKKATDKRPVPPTPSPTEIEPDVVLMPEAWGKIELPVPQMSSKQASRHAPKQQQQQQQQKKKKKRKREEVSVAASLANSAAQDEQNSRQGAHFNTPDESSDSNEDFTIHSAEEARRAIIWGEILQRKY